MPKQKIIKINEVLERIKMIAQYIPWPAVKAPLGHGGAWDMGAALLGVSWQRDRENGGGTWKICRRWRSYLRAAGIDDSTFAVADWAKFSLAWQQLTTGNLRSYSDRIQRLSISRGLRAPLARDYVYFVNDSPAAKKDKPTEQANSYQSSYEPGDDPDPDEEETGKPPPAWPKWPAGTKAPYQPSIDEGMGKKSKGKKKEPEIIYSTRPDYPTVFMASPDALKEYARLRSG
jgi:hypothetical protein